MKVKNYSIIFFSIMVSLKIAFATDIKPSPLPAPAAGECNLPKRDLKEGELPSNYVHCPILQQMKFYREKVYDPALREYNGNVNDLKDKPISGLSLVLENAFALVNDYMANDLSRTEDEKKPYRDVLENLWRMVSPDQHRLTSAMFQYFNERLALFITFYKEKRFSRTKTLLNPYEDEDFDIDRKDVIFIIYGNPNPNSKMRNISPYHFVEQYCNPAYSSYIAFFDVLSAPKEKPTQKDPHWSMENGTSKMLKHDFDHISRQVRKLMWAKDHIMHGCQVAEHYKSEEKYNEYKILTNFLFLIIHEMPLDFKTDSSQTYFEVITKKLSEQLKNLYEYGSAVYKRENRDWEFVLKSIYKDSATGEIKAVHDQEGKTFLPIQWDPLKNKVSRPFSDSPTRKEEMKSALIDGYDRFTKYAAYLLGVDMNSSGGT